MRFKWPITASEQALSQGEALPMAPAGGAERKPVRAKLDEDASPTAGRRFTRA